MPFEKFLDWNIITTILGSPPPSIHRYKESSSDVGWIRDSPLILFFECMLLQQYFHNLKVKRCDRP